MPNQNNQELTLGNLLDHTTKIIKNWIDIVFIEHPTRTSLGVLVGFLLCILVKLFSPLLNQLSWMSFQSLSEYHFVIIGIAIMHFPTIITFMFKRSELGEEVEKAFKIIKKAKTEGLPDWKIGEIYVKLCESALKNVQLKESIQYELKKSEEHNS